MSGIATPLVQLFSIIHEPDVVERSRRLSLWITENLRTVIYSRVVLKEELARRKWGHCEEEFRKMDEEIVKKTLAKAIEQVLIPVWNEDVAQNLVRCEVTLFYLGKP